jgi:anti-sigma-K factor RskA
MSAIRPDTGASADDALQQLAGEYVMGTLPAEARRAVQRRLALEPALAEAVAAWEERLLPLTGLAAPLTPSDRLWRRIERSLEAQEMPDAEAGVREIAPPRRWVGWASLSLWRGLAGTGFAMAAIAASVLLTRAPPDAAPRYMVVLVAPQDKSPGWVVQAGAGNDIRLIPLGAAVVPADKVLQFWTKGDNWAGPVSLGLVTPGQSLHIALDKLPPLQPNQLFELTLEQANGSPTGKPTGPIQFIGRAVEVI